MEPRHGRTQPVRPAAETVAVAGRRVTAVSPRSLLRVVDRPRFVWSTADTTLVAGGAAVMLTGAGSDRFAAVRRAARSVLGNVTATGELPAVARPRVFGGFAFHDDHDRRVDGAWRGYPDALFVLPAVQLTLADGDAWLTAAAAGHDAADRVLAQLDRWVDRVHALPEREQTGPPGISRRRPSPDREGWREQVRSALAKIEDGLLRKVVLAQSLSVDLDRPLSVSDALGRLGRTYPTCTRFLVEPPTGGTFFGATPERLVSVRGRSVRTTVLAGSTGRGDTTDEDDWLADELRRSRKDVHEHEVVLDAVGEQLEPLADEVETGPRRVRKLATVQHLETPVEATLDRDRHVLELVETLHPTPSVGGMPQAAALQTIREHETFERGWYAAPVGWIDADGNGAFAVALRSAVADGNAATLFAGAGIVADSDPDREWGEVQLKYRPILDELA